MVSLSRCPRINWPQYNPCFINQLSLAATWLKLGRPITGGPNSVYHWSTILHLHRQMRIHPGLTCWWIILLLGPEWTPYLTFHFMKPWNPVPAAHGTTGLVQCMKTVSGWFHVIQSVVGAIPLNINLNFNIIVSLSLFSAFAIMNNLVFESPRNQKRTKYSFPKYIFALLLNEIKFCKN